MLFFKEIRDIYRYFTNSNRQNFITFYSDKEIYYQYYKGTIEALLLKSNTIILYITSDDEDQILKKDRTNLLSFYINTLVPLVFPFINTKILIMTMTEMIEIGN